MAGLNAPTCGDSVKPDVTWQVSGVDVSFSKIVDGSVVRVEVAEHYPPTLVVRKIVILDKPDRLFQFFIAWCGASRYVNQICSVKLSEDAYRMLTSIIENIGPESAFKLIALAWTLCTCSMDECEKALKNYSKA